MSLSGNVINGTIVLDQPAALPDGTRVELAITPCRKTVANAHTY